MPEPYREGRFSAGPIQHTGPWEGKYPDPHTVLVEASDERGRVVAVFLTWENYGKALADHHTSVPCLIQTREDDTDA